MKGADVRRFLALMALGLAGCGYAGTAPDVDMMVKVTAGGKPVNGVTINFQPTVPGSLPRVMPIEDGNALGNMTPGKYAYFVTEGKDKAAYEAIPKQYREASLDRQVEVKGETIELALD